MLKNYKELKVWQKSCELCIEIYTITGKSPREQRYGLTSQIRRSVVSIPSNTAEGYGRKSCWRWTLKGSLFKRQKKKIKKKLLTIGQLEIANCDIKFGMEWRRTIKRNGVL
jgi:hypothetical protein